MKNLAIITPTLANGGAERIISTLSQSTILKEQYSLKIITFDNSSKDYLFECDVIDLRERFSKELNAIKPIRFLNYIKIINKIKNEMQFDIVLSFMENMGIVNAITKKNETAIHAVSSYLSGQFDYSKSIKKNLYVYLFRLLIRIFFNKLDGILTISKESKVDLIENFKILKKKIIVSYNPYDIKMINKMSEEDQIQKDSNIIRIVNMGSLIDVKAQWNILRAFQILVEENNQLELLFIGRGENEQYLKNMTNKYHLNAKVKFIGYDTNPFKYLKNSDIYIMSSVREGLPNALIEAMVCGLPVIATDCSSGPREILAPKSNYLEKTKTVEKSEFGILVPVNKNAKKKINALLDEQEKLLIEAIRILVKDKEMRKEYSIKSIKRSLDFDAEKIIPIWLDAIEVFDHK